MEVILDCRAFTSREATHRYLKQQFGFFDGYGCNLDALYDCLTDLGPCSITLAYPWALSALGEYALPLLETFLDAAQANPNLTLK